MLAFCREGFLRDGGELGAVVCRWHFLAFRLSIVQVGLFYAILCPSAFLIVGGELGCYIRRGLWLFGMNDFARTG